MCRVLAATRLGAGAVIVMWSKQFNASALQLTPSEPPRWSADAPLNCPLGGHTAALHRGRPTTRRILWGPCRHAEHCSA